jgi:hypothetical protein
VRGEQHTQDSNPQHNHAHKSQLELKVQHTEFATQMEIKSLTQRIKCVGAESRCFRILREFLGTSFMRLGVPFIAPRQLEAVGDQHGRLSLPSVMWCTGRTVTVAVWCAISFLFWRIRPLVLGVSWRTGHCPVCRGLRDRPLHWRPLAHRIVRCTTGQSGEL